MDPTDFNHILLLAIASAVGSLLNALAGGGSLLLFPLMIAFGVPPIVANATTAVAMWPGSVASAWAYRLELRAELCHVETRLWSLSIASITGGLIGAGLLLVTPNRTFGQIVPILTLFAALTFTYGRPLQAWLAKRRRSGTEHTRHASLSIAQLLLAIYGGYFGGGMGIIMLSILALFGMQDIHRTNSVKIFLAVLINGVAVVAFILAQAVMWKLAGWLIIASLAGGYGGAHLGRRLPPHAMRRFISGVAWMMTGYFFWKEYS